jgi:hypothetical protein
LVVVVVGFSLPLEQEANKAIIPNNR